jgi:hypothetical protein
MNYPKWKYRKNPQGGFFQSVLVADEKVEKEIGPTWTDDPHEHGIKVVPLPAELDSEGVLMHHGTNADANGRFAYGPPPTFPGIAHAGMGR